MEPQGVLDVYEAIVAHIRKQGGAHSSWYVGTTNDWQSCLFEDHHVPHKNYWCTVHRCFLDVDAHTVVNELLHEGCDGGEFSTLENSVYVYAYLKGPMTNP
jgi:hypothetical protein